MPSNSPRNTTQSDAIHAMLATWGREIGEARALYGLTEKAFASCLFVPPETILRLERGDPAVSLGIFVNALWALGLHERLEGEYVSLTEITSGGEDDLGGEVAISIKPRETPSPGEGYGVRDLQKAVAVAVEGEEFTSPEPAKIPPRFIERWLGLGTMAWQIVLGPVTRLMAVFRRFKRARKVMQRRLLLRRRHMGRSLQTHIKALRSRSVDARYFAAWATDRVWKPTRRAPPADEHNVVRLPTRRELRRQVVSQAVARARRLNSVNSNVPTPSRRRARS